MIRKKGEKHTQNSLHQFVDYMIVHLKNPRESMIKLPQSIKEFSKLVEYKAQYRE